MKILSLAPLAGPGLDALRSLGELELDPWNADRKIRLLPPPDLLARLGGVEVLLVEADRVGADVIAEAGSLRIIGATRGDPVNIDLQAAAEAGIPVITAPGRNADAVAELTVGLVIAVTRGIVHSDDDVRAGRWYTEDGIAQQRFWARELTSLTVGLVGCGAVGRATGRRLAALGSRVIAFDPYADADALHELDIEPVDLDTLLSTSDVISIHALVTDETKGMLGPEEIGRIKPGAYLVNAARYAIVQEEPMLEALRSGQLAGAAFDHFEGEFLPPDHPLISMPNVILTPHIGGSTEETVEHHTRWMADGVQALLDGREPPNVANPAALPAFLASR
jgi:D-3-phosphoglycerate dehydrogenase / 2-oxoglutarate reductase